MCDVAAPEQLARAVAATLAWESAVSGDPSVAATEGWLSCFLSGQKTCVVTLDDARASLSCMHDEEWHCYRVRYDATGLSQFGRLNCGDIHVPRRERMHVRPPTRLETAAVCRLLEQADLAELFQDANRDWSRLELGPVGEGWPVFHLLLDDRWLVVVHSNWATSRLLHVEILDSTVMPPGDPQLDMVRRIREQPTRLASRRDGGCEASVDE